MARSPREIQQSMSGSLQGDEPGLIGYWNFESAGGEVIDASVSERTGQLVGQAKKVEHNFPRVTQLPTVVSGRVYGMNGLAASQVTASLKQGGKTKLEVLTSALGDYRIVGWIEGKYDLYTTKGTAGQVRESLQLHGGKNNKVCPF